MSRNGSMDQHLRSLTEAQFREYGERVTRGAERSKANQLIGKRRGGHRRDFLTGLGIASDRLDQAIAADNRHQKAELDAFLKEHRLSSAKRTDHGSEPFDHKAYQEVLKEAGHKIVPVAAASIFAPDKARFDRVADSGPIHWIDGPIESGWIWPDDPTRIKIADSEHHIILLCWDNDVIPEPEYTFHFSFTPATSGTYELTGVIGFHGYYILIADDGYLSCRWAKVKLSARTRVHQASVLTPWNNLPPLLDVYKEHASEVTNFDHTGFLWQKVALRGGEPVTFTVNGKVKGYAQGGNARGELNFASGSANYIEPLFMGVQKVG